MSLAAKKAATEFDAEVQKQLAAERKEEEHAGRKEVDRGAVVLLEGRVIRG